MLLTSARSSAKTGGGISRRQTAGIASRLATFCQGPKEPTLTPTRRPLLMLIGYSNDPHHGTPCACADGGFCRGVGAGHVPWPGQQTGQQTRQQPGQQTVASQVACQGNKATAARAARAAPAKED